MFKLFKKKEENSLIPLYQKERPSCPFYSFQKIGHAFLDISGNGCGLICDSHSPCQMEMEYKKPDWNNCNYENKELLEYIANNYQIFPKEFFPKNAKSWEGMPFKDWQKYILG